ncbi:unnamed protein product [Heterobilharzia americana]|nr:unnamed protein product [Heterobilharzia americana]
MGVSENVINNPVKKEKLPLQHNYFQSYNLGSKWKHSRWDLIIDFLRPTDSDTYTCMLMGRTSQMIRYHVVVNDSVPRINYSRKKLISISSPQSIVIGSSFNLTCSVRVTKDQSVSIAIDWFRPTYSFQSPSSRHITLINAYKLGNVLSKKSELQSYTTTNPNVTAVVSQLAHSFQQVTSRTSMGVTIYKQVTGESNHYYRSEVLLTVQSSSENDGGLYECRVYEAANYGQEHIVDRAFLDLIIRKRYPHNSFEQSELNEKLRNLLSVFWKLNPSTQNDKLHDQYAQNDVATRVKARYTAQDKNQRADHIFQSLNNDNKIKFSLLESQNPRMRIRTIGNSMSHLFFYRILLDIPVILNILLAVN